ncbi:unnamed protein product [Caenorhabditis nigoni]
MLSHQFFYPITINYNFFFCTLLDGFFKKVTKKDASYFKDVSGFRDPGYLALRSNYGFEDNFYDWQDSKRDVWNWVLESMQSIRDYARIDSSRATSRISRIRNKMFGIADWRVCKVSGTATIDGFNDGFQYWKSSDRGAWDRLLEWKTTDQPVRDYGSDQFVTLHRFLDWNGFIERILDLSCWEVRSPLSGYCCTVG